MRVCMHTHTHTHTCTHKRTGAHTRTHTHTHTRTHTHTHTRTHTHTHTRTHTLGKGELSPNSFCHLLQNCNISIQNLFIYNIKHSILAGGGRGGALPA